MKILYVRHGQTDWNNENKVQGRTDNPLNDIGVAQAYETAKKLEEENIDIIISSPQKRAFQTAEIINEKHNKKIEINDKFVEVGFGDWEGQSLDLNEFDFVKYYVENHGALNGESTQDFTSRIYGALDDIIEKYKNCDTILIVAHGFVWRAVHMYFNPSLSLNTQEILFAKNCEVYEYYTEGKK